MNDLVPVPPCEPFDPEWQGEAFIEGNRAIINLLGWITTYDEYRVCVEDYSERDAIAAVSILATFYDDEAAAVRFAEWWNRAGSPDVDNAEADYMIQIAYRRD